MHSPLVVLRAIILLTLADCALPSLLTESLSRGILTKSINKDQQNR